MNESANRRDFLKLAVVSGGGFLLGFHLPAQAQDKPAPPEPNAYLRIGADESITVISNYSEMGQGVYTTLAMFLAEELEADWSRVRVEAAPVEERYHNPIYFSQWTGGSTSSLNAEKPLRRAGAAAREMLIAAAAKRWGVPPETCHAENGQVLHAASNQRLSYGSLAADAAKQPVPAEPKLKAAEDFKLIGKAVKRLDTPGKIDGSAVFGIDVKVEGMLVALVARPPVWGAIVKEFDSEKALAIPGVRHVVALNWSAQPFPTDPESKLPRAIAVVAEGFYAAKLGREALTISWTEGKAPQLDSEAQRQEYLKLADQPGLKTALHGNPVAAGGATVEAIYELPYLAHAPMEPLNCVADRRADSCEIWIGTQWQTGDRDAAVEVTGLKPEQVKLHTTFLGGGFGRRSVMDCHIVREAVEISQSVGGPVKVIWTREDDIQGGYYRPRALHRLSAAFNAQGQPVNWLHRIVCQSQNLGVPGYEGVITEGVDNEAVEGAVDLPYKIAGARVEWTSAPIVVPVNWFRSVGHSHTTFAVECFVDELARAARQDPYTFRLSLLGDHPRHRAVLEEAARQAGWGQPLPEGRARGIAVHESYRSVVAQVVEVSLQEGFPKVHRVVCVIDCGRTVNPEGVRMQMEGSIAFALSAALHGEIAFKGGRTAQSNFHDYRLLRIQEMPRVETTILPSTADMGGVGEPGVPPLAPALANALHALTGKPVRRLPVRPDDFKI